MSEHRVSQGRSREPGGLRRSLRKFTGILGSGSIVATALVVGGLGAGAAHAAPLSDNENSIYGVRGPASTSLNGGVFRIDTDTMQVVTPAEVTDQRNGNRSSNALGVSADGVYVYTVDNGLTGAAQPAGAVQLRQHNTETGETNTFTVPTGFGVTALRGAVSPVTGIFYFSGANAVYAFDPATDEIFAAGSLPAGNATSNGDFAFGRNGALYTFVAANLYETPASALPTSASSDAWPMKLVADVTAFTDLSAQGANGIAFGGNGNVYGTTTSGNTTYLIEYDMARDSFVQQQTISSDGNNFVDLASRHFVNTLSIRIDLPEGRFADGDQFDFDLVGEGDLVGSEATTSGNSPGVQDEYAGPVVASPGGAYEVSTSSAGSADLSNYITSIECVDVSGAPVEVTGSSPAWNVVFPTVTSGTDVECTITATPIELPVTDSGTTTGLQGQQQRWQPESTPGTFPIDGDTLTLVDAAGEPVSEIVIDGVGRYEVVGEEIVFTPEPTFTGEAPTVGYRISDEAGHHATGEYTPTVTAVEPVAEDDASTGSPNAPQSVDPLANDAPGHPEVPLVPESLALVDPETGDPAESVTVPEGVYTIDRTDPDAPRIVFTPNENYFGTPTPVDYTVEDENGTPTGAQYQPDVVTDPIAVNDGATTGPQGLPQSWTPEPIPGEDFPVDWSTLTLLDSAGDPTDEIVVDGVGRYEVVGQEIVFTPEPTFTGEAPTVEYRISDEAGQHAVGEYTPSTFAVTPVADDDTSTGWWNTPQSVNPLLNDAPGHPDVPLVPESLTLLDAEGNEVETVTVPEGVYTIDRSDPDAPLIVFTPNRGFTGIPTAVEYRVLDANGTAAEAEYQPFVRGPVGDEDLAQTLVCTTPMVFDLAAGVDGLDPRSVTLVDGAGEHVTEIVVDGEGTWRLDPETGVATFTPAGCFLGDLTPVNWEGWLLDGTPVSGVLSGTYVEEIAETGGDATPLLALGALSALLLAAGSALLIRRRRVLA